MEPVDFALDYVRRGYVVMPLERCSKKPHKEILKKGWSFADVGTTLERQVKLWWRRDPAANVGIVHGPRSRLIVIDVDVKKGDGYQSLQDWESEIGITLPPTLTIRTPSGGGHLWFRMSEDETPIKRIGWLANVDALAGGGLVPAPPSCARKTIHEQFTSWEQIVEYEIVAGDLDHIADVPFGILDDIRSRPRTVTDSDGVTRTFEAGDKLPPTIEFERRGFGWYEGSRDRECFRLARRLFGKYRGDRAKVMEVITICVGKTPATKVVPGKGVDYWGADDVQRCVDSAERFWQRTVVANVVQHQQETEWQRLLREARR